MSDITVEAFEDWLRDVILPALKSEEEAASIAEAPPGRFPRRRKLSREAWCQKLLPLLTDRAEELTLARNEEKRKAYDSLMSHLGEVDDEDELQP